jgi:hypothetical protein
MAKPSRSNVANRESMKQLNTFIASHLAAAGLRHSRAPGRKSPQIFFVVFHALTMRLFVIGGSTRVPRVMFGVPPNILERGQSMG